MAFQYSRRSAVKAAVSSAAALLVLLTQPAAFAQSQAASEPSLYTGADRQQRLLEGAKKEGELQLYTVTPLEDLAALTEAFEKKYGIKVKVWRSGSDSVLQRVVSEARAGRFTADIIENNGPELEALHREKLLQEVKSPYLADLIPQAVPRHREWAAVRMNIFSLAYNTGLVKKEDLPKSYEDLLHPKWKGKLGIEATDVDWFAEIMGQMGEAKGVKLFRDIGATNGLSIRKGHSLLANLVASGEVPLALTVYNYKAEQLKSKGAALDWFVIPPALAQPNGVAMTKRAPHPHAAVLFYDFLLSDAQAILAKRDFVPTSTKVETALNKMPIKFIDSKVVLDEHDKWSKLYDATVLKQSR
ncbi:MAG: fbpA 2 [Noviherbaspirillum sp.]|nr:fbpA 2 [Noviherbaspirillum sp.]